MRTECIWPRERVLGYATAQTRDFKAGTIRHIVKVAALSGNECMAFKDYMLRSMKDMKDYTLGATDGEIGRVRDYYFDDEAWVVRYLVVKLDPQGQREVLISPIGIHHADWSSKILTVLSTCAQIRGSPDIDTHKPVSRQNEMGYAGYYGYGTYWGGGGLWGAGLYPDELQAGLQHKMSESGVASKAGDVHLRSGNEILRYYVHASDGDIGHVEGLIIDERTWAIRYLIVNTSNWWLGHQVIVAPDWVTRVDWAESHVSIGLTRQAIKDAPPYSAEIPLSEDLAAGTHTHYGRENYRHNLSR